MFSQSRVPFSSNFFFSLHHFSCNMNDCWYACRDVCVVGWLVSNSNDLSDRPYLTVNLEVNVCCLPPGKDDMFLEYAASVIRCSLTGCECSALLLAIVSPTVRGISGK